MSKFFGLIIIVAALISACDFRSGTAMREMEKFNPSPTPYFSPFPTPTPVDPAESITVDTSQDGAAIQLNGYKERLTGNCQKFNRVMVNGDDNEIALKGGCDQIMINGDRNKITGVAGTEFVFNGSGNTLTYSRFVNAKQPRIVENSPGNQIEKVSTGSLPANK